MKTHTFNNGRYVISFVKKLYACCDLPHEEGAEETLEMILPADTTFEAFHAALHEALHADDCPDEYVHGADGDDGTRNVARFMWRWIHERLLKDKRRRKK